MNDNPWIRDAVTPKQAEYIADTATGKSTFDIAKEKYVSQNTVRNTIVAAKERVGASSTNNLIAMAVSRGWIKPVDEEVPLSYEPANDE